MKKIITYSMLMFISLSVYANDIYVNQSGATLDLDITQDGQNNTVGSSGTASSVIGATTNLAITQVGSNNVMTFDVNGATYTGTYSVTGNSNNIDFNCDSGGSNSSCGTATASIVWVGSSNDIDIDIGETSSATSATVGITGASGSDSNTILGTIDGNSAILTLSVNGDTNNFLVDIDGNGDSVGHTYIHTHTGSIADVDITQSGIYDNMVTLVKSNIVVIPIVIAIIGATFSTLSYVINLTETVESNRVQIEKLIVEKENLAKDMKDMQNKQAELSAAYRMGEDLYRILADQVREQSYDIKDLNR